MGDFEPCLPNFVNPRNLSTLYRCSLTTMAQDILSFHEIPLIRDCCNHKGSCTLVSPFLNITAGISFPSPGGGFLRKHLYGDAQSRLQNVDHLYTCVLKKTKQNKNTRSLYLTCMTKPTHLYTIFTEMMTHDNIPRNLKQPISIPSQK